MQERESVKTKQKTQQKRGVRTFGFKTIIHAMKEKETDYNKVYYNQSLKINIFFPF